jgi:hypothetical protein
VFEECIRIEPPAGSNWQACQAAHSSKAVNCANTCTQIVGCLAVPVDVLLVHSGFEARGLIFGAPLALALGCAFVPLRKPGKLPGELQYCLAGSWYQSRGAPASYSNTSSRQRRSGTCLVQQLHGVQLNNEAVLKGGSCHLGPAAAGSRASRQLGALGIPVGCSVSCLRAMLCRTACGGCMLANSSLYLGAADPCSCQNHFQ